MGTLVLWRHGETAWNAEHRFQGCNADTPLTPLGRHQAAAAAPRVAAYRPDAVVTSPLGRARDTAAAVETLLGLTATVDDRLREIDVGDWCGLTVTEVLAQDPQYAAARAAGADYRHGRTGETATQLGVRVGEALRAAGAADGTTLVVGHGWGFQMGVANLLGWDFALSRGLGVMRNCAVSVLRPGPVGWSIAVWNRSLVDDDVARPVHGDGTV